MEDKLVVLYTMEGCPWCDLMKKMLDEENIEYHARDIDEHIDEFNIFVEVTGYGYVPGIVLVEDSESDEPKPSLYCPEKDFNDIEEGVEIIKNFLNN